MKIESSDHFDNVVKLIEAGKGAQREVDDVALSRYACYLIVQNGDPSKPVIAAGQTYFAVQTRRQELADEEAFARLDEDQKRLFLRREMKEHNKRLSDAAHDAGIVEPKDYAIFQNHGYKGLYGGLGRKEIHARKGLKQSQEILDHMGHEELAANLFRATQAEAKLRREHIVGKREANQAHYSVGKEVRETIKRLGGTMPEDLPTPEKSIKQACESEDKKKFNEISRKFLAKFLTFERQQNGFRLGLVRGTEDNVMSRDFTSREQAFLDFCKPGKWVGKTKQYNQTGDEC